MLQVNNLESGYGKLQVLRGINLDIQKGDLVAIVGPNGSGKSTTLKCIFGLLKTWKGTIKFNNENITNKRPDEIVKLSISYVPQGRLTFTTLTVKENLEMGAYIIKDKGLIKKRMNGVFNRFPILGQKQDELASFLSGGQQQMLSIGRALMLKPDLILLDEPSLGLSPKLMTEIFRKIKEINEQGTTVILVEQNARMALEICNKAYILENGRIALHGGKELARKKEVKELYIGH
jgi:branched-chain amino acid transport system ATP-binding protein